MSHSFGRTIEVGATVWLLDEMSGAASEVRLVGALEADESLDRVSVFSSLGRQLLGNKPGASITLAGPHGPVPLKILNIRRA